MTSNLHQKFVNRVGDIAEVEGHHPDIILAAKIDQINL